MNTQHTFKPKKIKSIVLIVCTSLLLFVYSPCKAQYRAPYKIISKLDDSKDSIWVLFPDVQAAKKPIVFSNTPISMPGKLAIGDSILLDSAYKLIVKVKEIKWKDTISCTITCELPNRQNAKLQLQYRWFTGGFWIIEGQTLYYPLSCDHLNIRMYSQTKLILDISYSSNCD